MTGIIHTIRNWIGIAGTPPATDLTWRPCRVAGRVAYRSYRGGRYVELRSSGSRWCTVAGGRVRWWEGARAPAPEVVWAWVDARENSNTGGK